MDLPYPRSSSPASAIHVVCTENMTSPEDVLTLQTLGGILARQSPSIYVVNSDPNRSDDRDDMTVFWLNRLRERYSSRIRFDESYANGDLYGLLTHYKENVTGYVWFDRASNSTNAAINYCSGSEKGVIAVGHTQTAEHLGQLGIPMLANLSGVDPYDAFAQFKSYMSNRVAVFQPDDGSKSQCLSAYAVFARCPIVEHPPGGSVAFDAVLANLANGTINAGFGWTSWDEHEFTAKITEAGGVVHASDFLYNLEVLANLPARTSSDSGNVIVSRDGDVPGHEDLSDDDVHTVAFVMSDGDNLQLLSNGWMSEAFYGSPLRGSKDAIPMGWSFSPATAVLMPSILDYVRSNLTHLDSLSAGPSGMGYVYPQLFESETYRELFARETGGLMRSSNMSLLNVIGVTPSEESVRALANETDIDGLIYFTFGKASDGYAGMRGNVDFVGDTPVVGLRLNLWDDAASGVKVGVDGLVRELQKLPKGRRDVHAYSIVVVHMGTSPSRRSFPSSARLIRIFTCARLTGSHNYSSAVQVSKLLEQDGSFDVVLPETLMARIRSLKQTTCPLPTGSWVTSAGELPLCGMSDKRCVFSCSGLNNLHLPVTCDLDVCHNLTLSPNRLRFTCSETGKPCGMLH